MKALVVDLGQAAQNNFAATTQIHVRRLILAINNNADAKRGFRDRRKQTLFIDARKLGTLVDRVPFNFSDN